MAVFQCTSCRRLLYRPDDLLGRAWQCPTCGPTVVSDEEVSVSAGLAALLEEEYRLGLAVPLPGVDVTARASDAGSRAASPAATGQAARMGGDGEPSARSLDDGETCAKRWGFNGFFLGVMVMFFGIAVSAINDGFSDPILYYLIQFLMGAAAAGSILGGMGLVLGNMVDVCDFKILRSKGVDKALDVVDDDEATRKWVSRPANGDKPTSSSDADSDIGDDPPLSEEADAVPNRLPARRSAFPTDIQPGGPPP